MHQTLGIPHFLKHSLLASSIIFACTGLTGCFLDDDDSTSTTTSTATSTTTTETETPASTTAFTVDVQAPDSLQTASISEKFQQFFIASAYAVDGSDLSSQNFAVTVVDADGNVVEIVELTEDNISQNPDGTWEIIVPGDPRFDCLIVVDINQPISVTVGSPLPANTIFAPTTEPDIEVDIASTVAFNEFIDSIPEGQTFESFGLDIENPADVQAVEAMVANIQENFEDLMESQGIDINTLGSIDDAIAAAETLVAEIIAQEVENLQNADTTSTMASIMSNDDGFYWFEAEYDSPYGYEYVEYGHIPATGVETFGELEYNSDNAELEMQSFTYTGSPDEDSDLVLTSTGWAPSADYFQLASSDSGTGLITLRDAALTEHQLQVSASGITNISERNIEDLLLAYSHTQAFGQIVDSSATFSTDAKLMRIDVSYVNDTYYLWQWTEDNEDGCYNTLTGAYESNHGNGNCNIIWNARPATENDSYVFSGLTWDAQPTEISQLISDDVEYAAEGFVGMSNGYDSGNNYFIQFVDNDAKTAKYFKWNEQSDSVTQIATATWEEITLPNLSENATAIRLVHPEDYMEERDYDVEERTLLIAHQNGFLRGGNFFAAGTVENAGEVVYNKQAGLDIIDAIDSKHVNVLALTDDNACSLESNWDDSLYDNWGAVVTNTAYSAKSHLRIAEVCRGNLQGGGAFIASDVSGKTFTIDNETLEFNSDGSGIFINNGEYNFTWEITEDGLLNTTVTWGNEDIFGENTSILGLVSYAKVGDTDTQLQMSVLYRENIWTNIDPDGAGENTVLDSDQGELYSEAWDKVE